MFEMRLSARRFNQFEKKKEKRKEFDTLFWRDVIYNIVLHGKLTSGAQLSQF